MFKHLEKVIVAMSVNMFLLNVIFNKKILWFAVKKLLKLVKKTEFYIMNYSYLFFWHQNNALNAPLVL